MQTLDLRGSMIPFTLLKISNAFRVLDKGAVIEILLGDSDLLDDLVKIIPEFAYELIEMEDSDWEDSGIRLQLKKSGAAEKTIASNQSIERRPI